MVALENTLLVEARTALTEPVLLPVTALMACSSRRQKKAAVEALVWSRARALVVRRNTQNA